MKKEEMNEKEIGNLKRDKLSRFNRSGDSLAKKDRHKRTSNTPPRVTGLNINNKINNKPTQSQINTSNRNPTPSSVSNMGINNKRGGIEGKSNLLKPFLLIIIFSFLTLIFAAPFATIVNPTPINGTYQTYNNIFVNLSTNLTEENYAFVDFDRVAKQYLNNMHHILCK